MAAPPLHHPAGTGRDRTRQDDLLAWMLQRLTHQGLAADEIAERCPVYADLAADDAVVEVRRDLEAMAAGDGVVLATGEDPATWTVTPRGALRGFGRPDAGAAAEPGPGATPGPRRGPGRGLRRRRR